MYCAFVQADALCVHCECRFFGGPFECRGFQWLVTGFVRGENLRKYIQATKQCFTRYELFTFFEITLEILEYVHSKRCAQLYLLPLGAPRDN